MIHVLKIKQCHLIHIIENKKTFDLRKNDRDFQVGDIIKYLPLDDKNYNVYDYKSRIPDFKINYILSDVRGLQHNHVCMSINEIDTHDK